LYTFKGTTAAEAVKYGPFDPAALRDWVNHFAHPAGTTPLGNSIQVASRAVLGSSLSHKHIVIITDGVNTAGPKPEEVMPGILRAAAQGGGKISLHFVAFDVDAKVFAPVKRMGATVLGASDQAQLNTQLEYIFEKKILLEDEEPAAVKPK
jgi:Mg-chelatase subunit ChlD